MSLAAFLLAAVGDEPAGGAAIGEIVIATTGAVIATTALLVLGLAHRSGRTQALARLGDYGERVSGLPGWAALPSVVATVSLLTAVFGMYWDISLHIDVGRDAGPLANPAHYFILVGLFGIFAAGWLAIVLPRERPGPSAVRITRDWHAPLGGVLIAACGAFSLIGFPLDDLWHRLFGQDVTLWGPTHLMLIGGASMTLVGQSVLLVEGMRATRAKSPRHDVNWITLARRVALTGALLIGLSTFQAEFDFGVPQFRFVFQPILIMVAAGVALVATRIWVGRGAALGAVAFFALIRGGLAVLVGPVLGETTPHLPLYLVEALVVEGVALVISTRRPLAFGLVSGVGIGTIGLAAEWGWSHVWMPLPWPSELLPEAVLLGLPAAVAAAVIGAWVGARLSADEAPAPGRSLRGAAVAAAAVVAVLVVYALNKPAETGLRADVTLTEVRPAPEREVAATVRIDPAASARDAEWLTVTAWQGDGLIVDRLKQAGPGLYRTTQPIPVHGNWKALIRLHHGNSLNAMPLFLPEDRAIPAPEVPALARFSRGFVADHEILQREQKEASAALPPLAYGLVAAIALALLALLAWGLHRLAATAGGGPPSPRPEPPRRSAQPAGKAGAAAA